MHVNDVPNGKKCGCICPECKDELTAKNNCKEISNHFAHQHLDEGRACLMTQLHMAAQYFFLNLKTFVMPSVSFVHNGHKLHEPERAVRVISAKLEAKVGKFFADVMLQTELGEVCIEICVTHKCTEEKVTHYQSNKIASLEYDLSLLKSFEVEPSLKLLKKNSIRSKWFYAWCQEALINQHIKELELEARKELSRQKQSARKSARKFVKNRYALLPSIYETLKCEIQGYQFDSEVRLFTKQEYQLDKIEITSEDDNCLIMKGEKFSKNGSRILWVAYLFSSIIPSEIKSLTDAVVIRSHAKGKGGKAMWQWHHHPKLNELRDIERSKFLARCEYDFSLKESTEQNEAELLNLSFMYKESQDIYFKDGYGKWKKWLVQQNLFKPSLSKKNPTYPALMKYHKKHPNFWMFDEWYVLVFTKLAEIVDKVPTNQLINTFDIFTELAKFFPLHPEFHLLRSKISPRFLSDSKHDLIFNRDIIASALKLFESEMVIKINHAGIIRTGSLLKALIPN